MIKRTIISLFNNCFRKKGDLEISESPLITFEDNKVIINSDVEIIIKGELKIKTDKHMILQTSKLPSNDEYEVYSLHFNPTEKDSTYIKDVNNE